MLHGGSQKVSIKVSSRAAGISRLDQHVSTFKHTHEAIGRTHTILSREFLQFLDRWPPGRAAGFYPCEPSRMQERGTGKKASLLYSVPRTDIPTFSHILIMVI